MTYRITVAALTGFLLVTAPVYAETPTSTTTKSCDANYCCTTVETRFTTFTTCVPNTGKAPVRGVTAR